MSSLKYFLEEAFSSLKRWKEFQSIHIVMGNESCDLDSTMCSLAYGYYLSQKLHIKTSTDTIVFPVVNVPSEEFPIRTEHCSLLKDINIDLNKIIYRSEIKIDEMILEKKNCLKTYLVDHHVLNKKDEVLKTTVHKIFDHRPLDKSSEWSSNTELRIEPVGSCATLIADEILKEEGILFKELAYLLYCTIVFDTLALLPENKKATPLDLETAKKLEEKFGFKESRLDLFKKIVDLHGDVSHLTPAQLLIRDLKFVDNIPIPGLPMLVENFSKLPEVEHSLNQMGTKCDAPLILLIGIEANPVVKRDIGIFLVKDNDKLENLFVNKIKSCSDFRFEEYSCEIPKLRIFRQNNIEKSRKQIIPIVRNFIDTEIKQ